MRNEKQASAFREYQRAISDIEDFFEYRYLTHSKTEIGCFVNDRLYKLMKKLEEVYDGK